MNPEACNPPSSTPFIASKARPSARDLLERLENLKREAELILEFRRLRERPPAKMNWDGKVFEP